MNNKYKKFHVFTENKTYSFFTGREARKFARAVGASRAKWWQQNQTLHHGGGERCAVSMGIVEFGPFAVGVNWLVYGPNEWVTAGHRGGLGFLSESENKGWATPGFLKKYIGV